MTPESLDDVLEEMDDDEELFDEMVDLLSGSSVKQQFDEIGQTVTTEYVPSERMPEGEKHVRKDVMMWGCALWLRALRDTPDFHRIYIFPSHFLERVELLQDSRTGLSSTPIFNREVLFFPFHQKDRGHWGVAAIMNPGSIFEDKTRLDATRYPVIVSADSSPDSTFEYPHFEILRNWLYEFARATYPLREILTPVRLARLDVPIQQHRMHCGYQALINMRQIFEHRCEILDLLPIGSESLVMEVKNLADDAWNRLWIPKQLGVRLAVLEFQITVCERALLEHYCKIVAR